MRLCGRGGGTGRDGDDLWRENSRLAEAPAAARAPLRGLRGVGAMVESPSGVRQPGVAWREACPSPRVSSSRPVFFIKVEEHAARKAFEASGGWPVPSLSRPAWLCRL